MRKKPMQNNYGGHRKQRFGGGQGGGHNHGGHNRPRRNYSAAREKYLAQARDALAAGDRVLAENYFQHADHCYRMMVEEGYRPNNNQNQPQQQAEAANTAQGEQPAEEFIPQNTNALPAFLTATYEQPKTEPVVQNWEERDEA
jgi:hypothetical protein